MPELPTAAHLPPTANEPLDITFNTDLLLTLARHFAEHGDAFRAYSPMTGRDIYVLSHPDHVRHVLATNDQNYTKGLGIDRVGLLLGNGIMTSEGELWRRQRKTIQRAFHSREIAAMASRMIGANLKLREKWLAAARNGERVNVTRDLSEVTLEIVLSAVFGEDLDRITAQQGSNLSDVMTEQTPRNLAFAYKVRSFSRLVVACIERRRKLHQQCSDLLAVLMDAQEHGSDQPVPDQLVIDEVMTLIVAGHETTASALNWMWYLLSQHPEIEERLVQEVDTMRRDVEGIGEVERLPYTRQVIEETLRLYPPGWLLTRRAIGSDKIGDYFLPAGADVFISPYLVHRHPRFWEEPDRFDPGRFTSSNQAARNRFAYLPFGLGRRTCVGEHFAMVEMLVHTALMARRIHLRYIPQQPAELDCHVNLRMRHSLIMTPETRQV